MRKSSHGEANNRAVCGEGMRIFCDSRAKFKRHHGAGTGRDRRKKQGTFITSQDDEEVREASDVITAITAVPEAGHQSDAPFLCLGAAFLEQG
jgi:hypothetical protein